VLGDNTFETTFETRFKQLDSVFFDVVRHENVTTRLNSFLEPGPPALDRLPKQRLLMLTQAAQMLLAFALGVLASAGVVQIWHVYVLAASLGVANAFDAPTRQSFVIEMVGRDDLMNAVALNSMTFNLARIIGPAIAGILIGLVGVTSSFYINGLSFLFVIGGLLKESEISNMSKIPVLGDLPVLGALFRVRHDSSQSTNLYIIVTPHIAYASELATVDLRRRASEEVVRVLAPEGMLLISSPNRARYIPGNPHHRHEYLPDELRAALSGRFAAVRMFKQHAMTASVLAADETGWQGETLAPLRRMVEPEEQDEVYTLAMAGRTLSDAGPPVVALTHRYEVRRWLEHYEQQRQLLADQAAMLAKISGIAEDLSAAKPDLNTAVKAIFAAAAKNK